MYVRLLFCVLCVFIPLINTYPSNEKCRDFCSNDAVCVIKENEPVCYCLPDWEGERCDLIREDNSYDQFENEPNERSVARSPECLLAPPNMCLNGGICSFNAVNNTFGCECKPEFIGLRCKEPSPCVGHCANNGVCKIDANKDPSCICNGTGFTGPQCKRPEPTTTIAPADTTTHPNCAPYKEICGQGSCMMVNDRPKCICKPGYQGDFCDEMQSGGASSLNPVPTIPTQFPVQTNPTQFPGQTNPTVIPGQTKPIGITCAQNPCRNNRPCYNNGNSYYCYCGLQFTGNNCEIQLG